MSALRDIGVSVNEAHRALVHMNEEYAVGVARAFFAAERERPPEVVDLPFDIPDHLRSWGSNLPRAQARVTTRWSLPARM